MNITILLSELGSNGVFDQSCHYSSVQLNLTQIVFASHFLS